jgi:hypothetical protein
LAAVGLLGVVALSSSPAQGAASVAAAPTLSCDSTWSYIRAGDNGYLKPDAIGRIYANGDRHADYWNMQFLKCRYSNWVLGDYAFLSNRTGRWLAPDDDGAQFSALGTLSSDEDHRPMFRPIWYDPNFSYLEVLGMCSPPYVGCPIVWINKNVSPATVHASWSQLNGWNLLRFEN